MRNSFHILTLLACALPAAGQWSNIGPEGGSVGFMAFDPQNPATVYAATNVGVFKSSDSGATWGNAGLGGFSVGKLILDPQRAGILYAIAARPNQDDVLFKLYKSTDSVATWTDTSANLPVNDVAIDPRNSDTLYASLGDADSGQAGIFKSTDGGATWIAVNSGPDTLSPYPLAIDPNGVVYVPGFSNRPKARRFLRARTAGQAGANPMPGCRATWAPFRARLRSIRKIRPRFTSTLPSASSRAPMPARAGTGPAPGCP
jgi:hypothetical protein